MLPVRQTVQLSGGAVVVRAWPARIADAHLHDLLTLTATLAHLRESWHEMQRQDVTPEVWAAFWRLAHASLEQGSVLPKALTWGDRLELLSAMYDLNGLEEAEGKLTALEMRAATMLSRLQGRTTPP